MCNGLGIDLCEVTRMEKHLSDDRFLTRYFTEDEIRYVRSKGKNAAQTLAGLFAAREALGKALGTGIDFDLRESEVCHDASGRPFYRLHGNLAERTAGCCFMLSISHEAGMAAAVCIQQPAG